MGEVRFPIITWRPRGPFFEPFAPKPQHLHVFTFPRLGDADNDGQLELAYSFGCAGQVVYKTDGRELWRYLDPRADGHAVRVDSLVPLFDLDRDGKTELTCFRNFHGIPHLCVVEGATGRVRQARQLDLPKRDPRCSVVPVALEGPDRPHSLLVHRDYWRLEMYSSRLEPLWKTDIPELGHTTSVADIDGDGRDELFTGTRLFRADGTCLWSKPELLAGTGETHCDSNPIADINGDGQMELLAAPAATVLDLAGNILWRHPMREVQAVRLLQSQGAWTICMTELPRYQARHVLPPLQWRSRRLPDVSSQIHFFDASGRQLAAIPSLHTPVVGDWDGDGNEELFCLAPGGARVEVRDAAGTLKDHLDIQPRVYISDMVAAPLLPGKKGCQLIRHEWSDDERLTTCVIHSNDQATQVVPIPSPKVLACRTCY